jgi:hypothetical protein
VSILGSERRGEKRLEVVVGEGCNQWLDSLTCFVSLTGSSVEDRPRFEETLVQGGGVRCWGGGDVIVVDCSGRELEGGWSESSRVWVVTIKRLGAGNGCTKHYRRH